MLLVVRLRTLAKICRVSCGSAGSSSWIEIFEGCIGEERGSPQFILSIGKKLNSDKVMWDSEETLHIFNFSSLPVFLSFSVGFIFSPTVKSISTI